MSRFNIQDRSARCMHQDAGIGIYAYGGSEGEPWAWLWLEREDGDEVQDQPTLIILASE